MSTSKRCAGRLVLFQYLFTEFLVFFFVFFWVQNALVCRLLFMLTRYLRLTNYMWMFCEGFYLHRLIAAAFAEQKSFVIFYLLGWGEVLQIGRLTQVQKVNRAKKKIKKKKKRDKQKTALSRGTRSGMTFHSSCHGDAQSAASTTGPMKTARSERGKRRSSGNRRWRSASLLFRR